MLCGEGKRRSGGGHRRDTQCPFGGHGVLNILPYYTHPSDIMQHSVSLQLLQDNITILTVLTCLAKMPSYPDVMKSTDHHIQILPRTDYLASSVQWINPNHSATFRLILIKLAFMTNSQNTNF